MFKIGDFLVVLAILMLSFGIFFISKEKIYSDNLKNKYASIQVNGKEIKKIDINDNSDGLQVPIETEYGYNLLEFTNNGVKSIEASCPDKIDVKQGLITKPGEIIVCLPNRLVVEIKENSTNNVDKVDLVN